jgi:hypothetical protein
MAAAAPSAGESESPQGSRAVDARHGWRMYVHWGIALSPPHEFRAPRPDAQSRASGSGSEAREDRPPTPPEAWPGGARDGPRW